MRFFIVILFLPFTFFGQTFTGGSGVISDYTTTDIPLTVTGLTPTSIDTVNFGLEQICLNLTHTWDSDMDITLVAPDGTSVQLLSGVGGDGDNMQGTCFRWDVTDLIINGSAPFTGTYKPMGQMGIVNNTQDPNGTWILRIHDGYGGDEGNVSDWSLTFGSNPATYFDFKASNLPIVVINTNGQNIPDSPKIFADMGIIYNGPGVRNHLADPKNNYNGKIGIEIHGNYSASLPQKPYAFELEDVNGNQIDSSILGMPSEHDWLLVANYNDKSFARNIMATHMFDTMGNYSSRNRLVDVVLNGNYQGIYLLCELIKRDAHRVNISKLDPVEITFPDVSGGYIVKFDYWDTTNSWQLNYSPIGYPGLDIHMVYYYPKPVDLVPQQKTYIQTFINDYETALYGNNFTDPVNGYRKYIDVPSFIDYFLVNEVTRNGDGFKKSRYFYKDKDHSDGTIRKLKAGPVWDFDWSQKDMWSGSEDGSGFDYANVNEDVHAPGWYIRLLEDTIFANELRCRYDDLRRTIFSENYLDARIDSVANFVSESQKWHFDTWGNLGLATGTPEVEAPSQTYAEEVQRLKDWYHRRLTWLDANMPGTLNGCSFAGINQISGNSIQIENYPNPFNSFISIRLNTPLKESLEIRLLDQTGRLVKVQKVNSSELQSNTFTLKDLEFLKSGVYFLELQLGDEKVVKKMMK